MARTKKDKGPAPAGEREAPAWRPTSASEREARVARKLAREQAEHDATDAEVGELFARNRLGGR